MPSRIRPPGTLYRYRRGDKATTTTYSGYASGPLIEDRLFIHLAAESNRREGVATANEAAAQQVRNHYRVDTPKFYGKIDWNINDGNTLEYTRFRDTDRTAGYYREFDYKTLSEGIAPVRSPTWSSPVPTSISSSTPVTSTMH